mmetsp:Transcript_24090/g.61345  ORF Transcript_24090/g.61345 Transcript_24090/m.61345 type:complete len:211 (-) Transcript_24090:853-1485(-)
MGRRWRSCSTTRSPSLTSCGRSWRSSSSSSRRSARWSCRRRRPNWRRRSGNDWNVNGLRNGCSPNAARTEEERKGETRTSLARPETRSWENWGPPLAAAAAAADAATPVVAATWAPWFRCRLALALGRSPCTPCQCRPEPLEPCWAPWSVLPWHRCRWGLAALGAPCSRGSAAAALMRCRAEGACLPPQWAFRLAGRLSASRGGASSSCL